VFSPAERATENMSNWSDTYKRYGPEVRAFLERRLWGRREEAEDLCQETFVRAVGAANQLRDPAKARSYLLRIANNLLISRLRRPNLMSSESDLAEDVTARVDPKAINPHTEAERSELQEKIGELLAQLPDDQRLAFEHGVLERRPYEQIAQEQNWTLAKVKTSVYRARKRMMVGLREYR
jgi:RNA polymerase sigma-70 factor (ECF subfamily)